MAKHHLTPMLASRPSLDMPMHRSHAIMPTKTGIHEAFHVMPVQTGIHEIRAVHWIPAFAGMTPEEHLDPFDAARREATRLAADAEDIAALERAERQIDAKGRGKKK